MFVRHFAAALGVFSLVGLAVAQENGRDLLPEAVSNWTAPPYWSPAETRERSVPDVAGREADRELAPMGALPSTPLPLTAVNPCRIVDTRGAAGPFGGPALVANATRTFNLPSGPCVGIPADAEAYSLNLTIIGASGSFTNAFLTAWATGDTQPVVSTLNFNANQLESNAAVVPAGTSGSINVFVNAPGHLLIDINGYYQAIPLVNTVNGLSGAVTLAPGSNVSITPSGQMLTIASTVPAAWSLTGNAATTPGTNFLGTTDNQRFEIKVNNQRVFRLEPTAGSPNVIGGEGSNSVGSTIRGATIGGGGAAGFPNTVLDDYGTVGGGYGNLVGDGIGTTLDRGYATVGGGYQNIANGLWATVGGGSSNHAVAQHATIGGGGGNLAVQVAATVAGGSNNSASFYASVAGGANNNASGNGAAIGGGVGNVASGSVSPTIPGGSGNTASGNYSLTAGRRAKALNDGAWVWGDSTDADVSSGAVNQFIARATGGFTFYPNADGTLCELTDATGWQCGIPSDRNVKQSFAPVDTREALARLLTIQIQTWSYNNQSSPVRHMGPMAQDFAAAYGLGADDKKINPVDANGVALAAIQALYEIVKEKDVEIEALKVRLTKLEEKSE